MKFHVTAFILVLALARISATSPPCDLSCPQDCDFGIALDRSDQTCPKCVCSDDKCAKVRCVSGTTCQLSTVKDCWNSECIDAATVKCVPNENKPSCEISCPNNCEFGVKLDHSADPDCPSCTCAADPCSNHICIATAKCQPSIKKDCWNSECFNLSVAACVPIPTQCELTCPKNCDLGYRLDRSNPECPKCMCAENGCMMTKCGKETTCQLVKKKECLNSQCIEVTSPSCVPISKPGKCPAGFALAHQKAVDCKNDAECKDDLKCCAGHQSNVCAAPCPVVLCKCASTHRTAFEKNSKGCSVCTCVPNQESLNSDPCSQSLKPGNCKGAIPRYFYHADSNSCKPFSYTGCKGNDNNFISLEYCEKKCVKTAQKSSIEEPTNACSLPMEIGPCRASLERFYYDTETKSCRLFLFGGCKPNENNFKTLEECNKRCEGYKEKPYSGDLVMNKCHLPKKIGDCRAAIPRYYFNLEKNQCEEFTYSGCSGNDNNFATMQECKEQCLPYDEDKILERLEPRCKMSKEIGPCRGSMRRFFFDIQSKSCVEFTYGGCKGNDNNFESLPECHKACASEFEQQHYNLFNVDVKPKSSKCLLPKVVGNCRAAIPKFYFDLQEKKCKEFSYGGCGGNDNNFEDLKTCEDECTGDSAQSKKATAENICRLPKEVGPCRGSHTRYAYDPKTKSCEKFIYGGCQGNENNFDSLDDCVNMCAKPVTVNTCMLAKDSGPCEAAIPMFYFNSKTGNCESFVYGGCQGNQNRFKTLAECLAACLSNLVASSPIVSKCALPKAVGTCNGYSIKYYYDKDSKRCSQFVYTGCDGNSNRFESENECLKECSQNTPITPPVPAVLPVNKCHLSPERGNCKGMFNKFFFNHNSGKCESFIYGGCQGNENRFDAEEDCQKECSVKKSVCTMPKDSGMCYASFPMFYYNSMTNQCEEFIYGGCQGNGNRFESKEECSQACGNSAMDSAVTPAPALAPYVDKCLQDAQVGPCRGAFTKYFLNKETGQCESFIYGGCGGNDNRFETFSQCNAECADHIKPPSPVNTCHLDAEQGNCRGSFPKFYFNRHTGKCESFIYGGCGGNNNRFETIDECNARCGHQQPKCLLPKSPGRCMAYFPRYYYDATSMKCERFVFGGCEANENNFETIQGCIEECSDMSLYKINPKCQVQADPGNCRGSFPKYFFNTRTNTCELFLYGGCGGNENVFEELDQCNTQCFNLNSSN